jgi:benzoate-CoA ligase
MDNAASILVDRPLDEGLHGAVAIVAAGRPVTYGELRATTDRAARGLRRLGVETGQRVALLLPDGVAFAATFLAAIKIGAVAVPLGTRLPPDDLGVLLRDAEPAVLVADAELLGPARSVVAAAGPHVTGFPDLVAGVADAPVVAELVSDDAMAFWLYTSGTTGTPKAAVHGHRTLLAGRHYGQSVLGIGADDRVFATSKLFFAYALGNALLIPLLARARTILEPAWPEPAAVAQVVQAQRPTLFFSVPTFYARLLRADLPADTFSSARACVSAGEPLPAAIYDGWRERFGVEILDGLGATETVFMVLSNRPGASRRGSTGWPVPGTEARLLDPDGHAVADGERGLLWVRTDSAAAGYWRRPEPTRRVFVDGWFQTGDVFERSAEGGFVHCGRADDRFKVAGMWVDPTAVEAAALDHPGVLEAGVVGAEAASGLTKPVLFVVPRDEPPGALAGELRARLNATLPPHQRPQDIVLVAELPRTATGKLQRFRLRELGRAAAPPRV